MEIQTILKIKSKTNDPNTKDHLTDNYKKEDLLYIILINKDFIL